MYKKVICISLLVGLSGCAMFEPQRYKTIVMVDKISETQTKCTIDQAAPGLFETEMTPDGSVKMKTDYRQESILKTLKDVMLTGVIKKGLAEE